MLTSLGSGRTRRWQASRYIATRLQPGSLFSNSCELPYCEANGVTLWRLFVTLVVSLNHSLI